MAIFKNFPKVSSLVKELRFGEKEANLAYKMNRLSASIPTMVEMLEASDIKLPEHLFQLSRDPRAFQWKRRTFFCEVLNFLGEFSGVEYMGVHKRMQCYTYYLNSGDTYAPTLVLYFHSDGTAKVTTCGDVMHLIKDEQEY